MLLSNARRPARTGGRQFRGQARSGRSDVRGDSTVFGAMIRAGRLIGKATASCTVRSISPVSAPFRRCSRKLRRPWTAACQLGVSSSPQRVSNGPGSGVNATPVPAGTVRPSKPAEPRSGAGRCSSPVAATRRRYHTARCDRCNPEASSTGLVALVIHDEQNAFAIISGSDASRPASKPSSPTSARAACRRIICLGDIIGVRPDPLECVDLVRENVD